MFGRTNISRESGDQQLMHYIRKGERKAFEILYDRYFDKLVWYARSFIDDIHKAEDVVQEVFIRIIEKPEYYNESQIFSTWIYAITGNLCKNILRDEQNRSRLMAIHVIPAYDGTNVIQHHATDYKVLQERLKTAYNGLNEKEKQIFILRFEQELSIKEIAVIMDIPEGSVKSGIYYLLKKFIPHVKEFTHET